MRELGGWALLGGWGLYVRQLGWFAWAATCISTDTWHWYRMTELSLAMRGRSAQAAVGSPRFGAVACPVWVGRWTTRPDAPAGFAEGARAHPAAPSQVLAKSVRPFVIREVITVAAVPVDMKPGRSRTGGPELGAARVRRSSSRKVWVARRRAGGSVGLRSGRGQSHGPGQGRPRDSDGAARRTR